MRQGSRWGDPWAAVTGPAQARPRREKTRNWAVIGRERTDADLAVGGATSKLRAPRGSQQRRPCSRRSNVTAPGTAGAVGRTVLTIGGATSQLQAPRGQSAEPTLPSAEQRHSSRHGRGSRQNRPCSRRSNVTTAGTDGAVGRAPFHRRAGPTPVQGAAASTSDQVFSPARIASAIFARQAGSERRSMSDWLERNPSSSRTEGISADFSTAKPAS